jgi:predicted ATPase/DNA-binding XRE family transcriptional regulator
MCKSFSVTEAFGISEHTLAANAAIESTDSFGYWVRRRRKALDLTQEELAQRVGCAVVTLRKIEADERRPSPQMAERLAQCLALPASELPIFLAVAAGERASARLQLPTEPTNGRSLGNLPAPMTSLIGQTAEIAAITDCLRRKDGRLLTLTGPVGVGKTRLAIEVGGHLRAEFRDGVYLVELASVQDPALVPSTTATVLGVWEARGRSQAQSVADYLAQKKMLLIFDNFEHLQPAATFLSALLAAAPGLRLLVTSRSSLRLYGEYEYGLAPLPLPESNDEARAVEVASVRLFYERAQSARADFLLTPALMPTVVEICRRLDGLPLAIELAANRIKLFTPQELLQRLERRLSLLTQGAVDLPPRLQGLESAIAWSFGLLSPSERILFARLAVFVGGFTLLAAEAVCAFPFTEHILSTGRVATLELSDIANDATALLDQSLLLRQDITSGSRFHMLETIREFALERLRAGNDLDLLQQRHAEYFDAWAKQAETHLFGPDQAIWLARLDREADNLRAALTRLLATSQVETAARMACALREFWQQRGHYSEGRNWLEQVLNQMAHASLPEDLRARTLQAAASLVYRQGDWPVSSQWLEESLTLFRLSTDQRGMARVLFDLGWIAIDQGDWAEASRLNQESLEMAREVDDPLAIYRALTNLGWTQLCTGERTTAATLFSEAYDLTRRIGHTEGVAVSLANLGWIALYQGDTLRTTALAVESIRLCHLLGDRELLAECLEILAVTSVTEGDVARGVQLSGASEALWEELHVIRPPTQHSIATHTEAVAAMRLQLPEAVFASTWLQGRAMSMDAVVAFALDGRSDVNVLPTE